MAQATAFSSSGLGLSSRTFPGAAVRVATARPAFLRIPAAHAPARSPAPLLCFRTHADFFAPRKVDGAAEMKVGGPAADVNVDSSAAAVIKNMMAGLFRPLLDNFHQLRSLKTVCDTEDYQIGMPYGALIACIACYQLWKMDPSTFVDAVLGYAFYKLSVLSSKVRKQGLSNDLFARIKSGLVVIWAVRDFHRSTSLDYIRYPVWFIYQTIFLFESGLKKHARGDFAKWFPVWYIYLTTFAYDVCGLKKHAKEVFSEWYADIQTKEGLLKLARSIPRLHEDPWLH